MIFCTQGEDTIEQEGPPFEEQDQVDKVIRCIACQTRPGEEIERLVL